jgi:hypothetical protein
MPMYKITAVNDEVQYTDSTNEIINLLLAGLPLKSLKIEEKPTNSQGFPMEMGECSECGRQSWHTRYIYKGWRSRCCNA